MSREWGHYTLTVTELRTQKIVFKQEYKGMSGHAMMDEQKFYRKQFPRERFDIDW